MLIFSAFVSLKFSIFEFLLYLQPPQPDDLAIICFTSGTTGMMFLLVTSF